MQIRNSICNKFFCNLFYLLILNFFIINNSFAASEKNPIKSKVGSGKLKIMADRVEIDRINQTLKFIGNTIIENDESSLLADYMEVIYDIPNKKKSQKGVKSQSKKLTKKTDNIKYIKKVVAHNNVKIFSGEIVASSKNGYFYPDKNLFVLEKNVVVNNGTSVVKGDKFLYNVTTKKGSFIDETPKQTGKNNQKNNEDNRVIIIINEDLTKNKKR